MQRVPDVPVLCTEEVVTHGWLEKGICCSQVRDLLSPDLYRSEIFLLALKINPNHRKVWVGRDLKNHLVPAPRDTLPYISLLQAPSMQPKSGFRLEIQEWPLCPGTEASFLLCSLTPDGSRRKDVLHQSPLSSSQLAALPSSPQAIL